MADDQDHHAQIAAEYRAAMERERAEWKILGDPRISPVDRLTAYARWRTAAERTMSLSIRLRDAQVRPTENPLPSPTPHPQ